MHYRILFACDLTPLSKAMLDPVMALARRFHAKVTLFHAYELLSPSTLGLYSLACHQGLTELEDQVHVYVRTTLNELKTQCRRAGIEAEIVVSHGHAGEGILAQAESSACDLIVLGNRGMSAFRSLLLGSTSAYVLHHCNRPIMVYPLQST